MRSLTVTVVLLATTSPAQVTGEPRPIIPAACLARFERARAELIERGFAPTSDKDTDRWLRLTQERFFVGLSLELRTSADGASTSYAAFVEHPRMGLEPTPWRVRKEPYCCSEHAAREDHLIQQVWSRANRWLRATVTVVEFQAAKNDPQIVRWRDMFVEVTRAAADDCLAARSR